MTVQARLQAWQTIVDRMDAARAAIRANSPPDAFLDGYTFTPTEAERALIEKNREEARRMLDA